MCAYFFYNTLSHTMLPINETIMCPKNSLFYEFFLYSIVLLKWLLQNLTRTLFSSFIGAEHLFCIICFSFNDFFKWRHAFSAFCATAQIDLLFFTRCLMPYLLEEKHSYLLMWWENKPRCFKYKWQTSFKIQCFWKLIFTQVYLEADLKVKCENF